MNNLMPNHKILQWSKAHNIAVLSSKTDLFPSHTIAIENSSDELLLEKIKMELDGKIIPQEHSFSEISRLNRLQESNSDKQDISISAEDINRHDSWESEPIINLVDSLFEQAIQKEASDLHIEPNEKQLRLRIRQDGLLNEFKILPLWLSDPILVRLKVLADVDITEKRIPLDGSFSFNSIKGLYNIRLSTIPTPNGEKCVLRLLPKHQDSKEQFKLSDLVQSSKQLDFLRKVFNSPQGLFLVTGPTGSGKTTTLHTGLREIIHKNINVTTIEDPIEYSLEGATQVQVNEKCGFTFPVALRSILRQDPDVIFIGEIRDAETAQIAVRAAQTGHLVLSTLHTNNAKAAFERLRDLGIDQSSIKQTLLGVLAQRLLRKTTLHPHIYSGRIPIFEMLLPDGSFVDGNLQQSAEQVLQKGLTDQEEILRILGHTI